MSLDPQVTVRDLYVRELEMRRGWRVKYRVRPWDFDSMEREHPIVRCRSHGENAPWVQIKRCSRPGCCLPPVESQIKKISG